MTLPAEITRLRAQQAEASRPALRGLAYRMVGSMSDAEDLVQEAVTRFLAVPEVEHPSAFLTRMVVRLCLDHLKSARVRRETYVGPWLPEPVPDAEALRSPSSSEWADDVSFALLLTLERLSPLERAAFLLHDVFDYSFSEVAAILGREEAACRQLAHRARRHVAAERPRFRPQPHERDALAQAFFAAVERGDRNQLVALLAEQAELISDSGGKRPAALRTIVGAERIVRFLEGVRRRWPAGRRVEVTINGELGLLSHDYDGGYSTVAVEIAEGRVRRIFFTRNPDKLGRFVATLRGNQSSIVQTPLATAGQGVGRRPAITPVD